MSYRKGNKQECDGEAAANRRSKVTPERVALLVVCGLLAAAGIVIYRLSFEHFQTKKTLQTLKDENEAMRKNLTDRLSEIKQCTRLQHMCPKPTEVKNNETCLKCEEGWEHHGPTCYYFSTNRLSWNQSREECRGRGGDLVQIDSREEQTFLEEKLREKMNEAEDMFWIGLTDSVVEGRWLWVDGSELDKSLTFWSVKEPDDWNRQNPDGEDCVRMGEKGGAVDLKCWFDQSCNKPHRRICEKAAQTGHYDCNCSV